MPLTGPQHHHGSTDVRSTGQPICRCPGMSPKQVGKFTLCIPAVLLRILRLADLLCLAPMLLVTALMQLSQLSFNSTHTPTVGVSHAAAAAAAAAAAPPPSIVQCLMRYCACT